MFSPTLTAAPHHTVISWLETDDASSSNYAVCSMDYALSGHMETSPRRNVQDPQFVQATDLRSASPRGWKYLAAAAGPGRQQALYVATHWDDEFFDPAHPGKNDVEALRIDDRGVSPLRYAPTPVFHSGPTGRASDPSVASARNRSMTVYVWEELVPGEGQVQLYFRVDRHAAGVTTTEGPLPVQTRDGLVTLHHDPFAYREDTARRQGGDICVQLLDGGIYLAHQGSRPAVFLLRLPILPHYTDAVVWDTVTSDLGNGQVGQGWFPNLAGATYSAFRGHNDVDLLVMVYEKTTQSVGILNEKVVGVAFAVSHPASGRFEVVRTFDLRRPIHASEDNFQLDATVSIAPEEVALVLGCIPVDIQWMEVFRQEILSGVLRFHATLRHCSFSFGPRCL